MTEKEKMMAGKIYDPSDKELVALRTKAHRLSKEYNELLETDDKRAEIIKELGITGDSFYFQISADKVHARRDKALTEAVFYHRVAVVRTFAESLIECRKTKPACIYYHYITPPFFCLWYSLPKTRFFDKNFISHRIVSLSRVSYAENFKFFLGHSYAAEHEPVSAQCFYRIYAHSAHHFFYFVFPGS